MSKTIAVIGATGTQGGSVVQAMLKAGWKVRALTRDPSKDSSKQLAAAGCEVVAADQNNKHSLEKAFENVHAIYANTNFFEHLMTGSTQAQAGEKEEAQGIALAQAAASVSTLEHYVWHTLPPASKISGGKMPVPHLDYKAKVDDYIRSELPELAKKTTYLYVGLYAQNFAFFPITKPTHVAGSDKYIWLNACTAKTECPNAGDVTWNVGIFVRQILAHPQVSKTKYTTVAFTTSTMQELAEMLTKVTGQTVLYQEVTVERYTEFYGTFGAELGAQFKFSESFGDWHSGPPGRQFIGAQDLGIKKDDLKTDVEALTPLKQMILG